MDAFKEKVDFSQKKQDLRPINSPFLQAGKDNNVLSIFDGARGGVERLGGEKENAERLGIYLSSLSIHFPNSPHILTASCFIYLFI